jgi:regulator of PEP synthase PpsR (kinase-PPPase family)
MGHSLMTQFDGIEFRQVTVPFISTVDKAIEAVRKIDLVAKQEGIRPIVFSTLVQEDVRNVVRGSTGFFLDFFDPFLSPLENELKTDASHLMSRAHRNADTHSYALRIDATNFALANDDGSVVRDYERADVILVGVSRSGKTPTCLYLAMQYGIFAANYPLTEDDLESRNLPPALEHHPRKLFGLTIKPDRLQQIRNERRPDSPYSSARQVAFEVRAAESLFERHGIPMIDATECSIEEISSRILDRTGIERRLRP